MAEWLVACDQPFGEVERPELRRLWQYIHGKNRLQVPSADTIKRRIIDLSNTTLEDTKSMIKVRPYQPISMLDLINLLRLRYLAEHSGYG